MQNPYNVRIFKILPICTLTFKILYPIATKIFMQVQQKKWTRMITFYPKLCCTEINLLNTTPFLYLDIYFIIQITIILTISTKKKQSPHGGIQLLNTHLIYCLLLGCKQKIAESLELCLLCTCVDEHFYDWWNRGD